MELFARGSCVTVWMMRMGPSLLLKLLLLPALYILAVSGAPPNAATLADSSRIRGENGEISLTLAVPLTSDGQVKADPGWMHMAAALMAIDHFNERNPTVVKELQDWPQLANCPFQLVNISVVDTGTQSHKAMSTLLQSMILQGHGQNLNPPDAIAGPYNDQPALELSVLATGLETPMVAFRGLDQNLVLPSKHPFYTQVYPDLWGEMEFLGEFLRYTGRTNYIALLHSDDDAVLQRIQVLKQILLQSNNNTKTSDRKFIQMFSYLSLDKTPQQQSRSSQESDGEHDNRGIEQAVEQISKTGYRTIIVFMTTPYQDGPWMGKAAHKYNLDLGQHFWIIMGGLDPSSSRRNNILVEYRDKPEGRFFKGAAYLYIFDDQYLHTKGSPFQNALRNQNSTFFQRLVQLNPIPNYHTSEFCLQMDGANDSHCNPQDFPRSDVLQIPELAERIGFAYDATMSIGIGACLALHHELEAKKASRNSTTTATTNNSSSSSILAGITGYQHLQGIRNVDFRGVTGRVRFQNRPGTPGSRDGSSIYFGVLNIDPPIHHNFTNLVDGTSYLDPFTHQWVQTDVPFVYADGTTNPPLPLRAPPEQNYLDPVIRAIGLGLMAIALLTILVSLIWIVSNRHHRVVIAAQPPFLYVLCLGATLATFVILTQSFDESYGWSQEMLDKACLAMPWLVCLGVMVTYSALFTKLWRVNKVLQFRRARIKTVHVLWPALLLFLLAVVMLSAWTAFTDFAWVREEIDPVSGETLGRCKGTDIQKYFIGVDMVVFIPMILTGIMAYKTRDVDDIYSESRWIFSMIMVQLQVALVSIPTVLILQDISTTGRYIGLVLIVWTFPMSTMGLIMIPKMLAVRSERRMGDGTSHHHHGKRGSTEGVRVTGLDASQNNETTHYPTSHQEHTSVALSTRQPWRHSGGSNGTTIKPQGLEPPSSVNASAKAADSSLSASTSKSGAPKVQIVTMH